MKKNSSFVCLFVCLCQVKRTFFFLFQKFSRAGFFEAHITNPRSIQLEILLLGQQKIGFDLR